MSDTPRTDDGTPIKTCDYCNVQGVMPTFMSGETVCYSCLKKQPKDSVEAFLRILECERTLAAQRTALQWCYEKSQPMQPFEDWVKEIGK